MRYYFWDLAFSNQLLPLPWLHSLPKPVRVRPRWMLPLLFLSLVCGWWWRGAPLLVVVGLDWTSFNLINGHFSRDILRHQLILKAPDHIWRLAWDSFGFGIRILFDKFFYVQISTTNSHHNLITFFDFHVNASLPKLVYALRLAQKQYFQIFPLWIRIDILL